MSPVPAPTKVAVIGAGMVGLSTAWFLQEHGVQVSVIERDGVAAGASWGNAGWLTPGIATPLPEPAVLKYGLRAVLSASSPVYVPPTANIDLLRFVTGFMRHSTVKKWREAMGALVPVNDLALDSFHRLETGGVAATTHEAKPFIAAYRTDEERATLLEEIEHIRESGGDISFDALSGAEARALDPALSEEIGSALILHDQRFIDPGQFVNALADSVRSRGGEIRIGGAVTGLKDLGRSVVVRADDGFVDEFDEVVIATGTWLRRLARPFGVTAMVQAGRGYSFSVTPVAPPRNPIYFPSARVACTPLGDRLRVAGMMEFRRPEAALDRRRIQAIVDSVRPLLREVDLDDRHDEWVGSRPCTPDGLPLIGRTEAKRVFVAGGHGMWGITLGPVTGRLLAELMVTGRAPRELEPFDPTR